MRLVYGIIAFLLTSPAFASSLTAKILLSFIPEALSTSLFVLGGYKTRSMYATCYQETLLKHTPSPSM